MASGPGTKGVRLDGRKEPRVPARIEVHLRKAEGSNPGEIVFTENICSRGAGLFTGSSWTPGEEVLVRPLRLRMAALGRIVYSHRHETGRFAVGIEVASPKGVNWFK